MKITKLSLVAALLIGSSAMAFENTKVTGDANLFYQTSDGADKNFFESGSSSADIAVNLNVTTDVLKTDSVAISAGLGYTVLTTLGLEGQMVDAVWGGAHDANTTVKVGRMELDTPLAFTETWSIEKNTFEAAVVVNQDIPNTTVVAAYIGRGNGGTSTTATGAVVSKNGEFTNYGAKGAYTLGAINNSWKPLTVQAWYYDVVAVKQSSWLQADLDMDGILVGAQYSGIDTVGAKDSSVYALMAGYTVKDAFTVKLAFSQVAVYGNAGGNTAGTTQSKLYTEAWWNYGNVTTKGTDAVNLTIVYIHKDNTQASSTSDNTLQVYITTNF
ncbi:hypothetical protein MNB_SM-4-1561 [hydrothermal vent metagenome]|uniref:Porin domain-containing protein n=1 Tax=hydrothermal vent metagenome TaxID=652676 RepID=A0A1W1BAK5_9ZZZZ